MGHSGVNRYRLGAEVESPLERSRSRPRSQPAIGVAVVLILASSAMTQTYIYMKGGVLVPDLISAIPVAFAAAIALPAIFSTDFLKHWGTPVVSIFLAILFYLGAALADSAAVDGLRTVAQVILTISCFFIGFSTLSDERHRGFVDKAIFVSCLVLSLILIAAIIVAPTTSLYVKNSVGGELLYLAIIGVAARYDFTGNRKSLWVLAPALIIAGLVTRQRTVAGLGAVIFALQIFLNWTKSKFAHRLVLFLAGAVSVFMVYLYLNTYTLPWFKEWNLYVEAKTGRQITSGRQLIWPAVFHEIMHKPIFGHGFSAAASQFTGETLSTHNAFLMVLLQVGFAGLLFIVGVLVTMGWRGTGGEYTPWRTLFTVTLFAVIINNTFETELIQNNFRISALLWLALGYISSRIPEPSTQAGSKSPLLRRVGYSSRPRAHAVRQERRLGRQLPGK
jgi:O-antigen ligase